mmetsp:Transcript_34565/g.35240  ORF Transcript_34565/g.35240 Transcript_34565/m.35240 type:complete len:245 (+) Transcript_34565:105-839(+)|eukprot:CAMPEP_0182418714 /NCGR_PEP_ID=MMETSP1167-20130531/3087_1 /TAXON_ID=2988 /ORGANISM="Mallomonas Sp, Strain CCMP3275" /LENGTH=244 /DNA_ID=CAMNT_0024593047 /DNA_START=95 /DNA_END=829 /DNA_ORIENTATION=+
MFSSLLFSVVTLVALSAAFAFSPIYVKKSAFSIVSANKLDGLDIDSDLAPLWNNVLVRVKDAKAETTGGIFIPDNAKERPTEGTIVATGPGRVHPETAFQLDIAVKTGQNVLYGKYDGIELKYNDVNHQLIKDDDVLLTYTGDEATLDSVECVKDQVLVLLPEKAETTVAGIIVNNAASGTEKRPDSGVVAKVGPGRQSGSGKTMPIQITPGDNVRFRSYAGSEIKLDKKKYLVIRAYDILAKW